jgi:polysaccharide export outer membrane protein
MNASVRISLAVILSVITVGSVIGQDQVSYRPFTTVANPAALSSLPSTAPTSEYRIGPEDVLDISVWRNAELTRTVPVRPDGRISLPLLNDITAANLTPMELRDVLAKGYEAYVKDAEVSVIVREIHSLRVSVVGRVNHPGRYELGSQATVLEALALAGGLTEFAKRDRIVVFRHDGRAWQRLAFDYDYAVSDNAELNFTLRAGDIVIVP